jgi:hypothetical protein
LLDFINYQWNTILHLKTKQELMQSQPIQIQREIFNENSLSPLLFCVVLISLTNKQTNKQTNKLNRAHSGYKVHETARKISHFLYVDDLKLLVRSEDDLENEIKTVKMISIDIKMYFGLEKCARICLKKGRVQNKVYTGGTFEENI